MLLSTFDAVRPLFLTFSNFFLSLLNSIPSYNPYLSYLSRIKRECVFVLNTNNPPLNYSFLAFDPPGSVDTVSLAVNDHGDSVGRFQDGAGVLHGYLRQGDGSFVTIDPPGSISTVAFDINNAGQNESGLLRYCVAADSHGGGESPEFYW